MDHKDNKLIITVAPGASPSAMAKHKELPRTAKQIADEVIASAQAGASIAHMHVVDENGKATTDLSFFRETVSLIRRGCDILIEGSTGGTADLSAADRSVSLDVDVELASLNTGSINYGSGVYVNSPADIDYWVNRMRQRRIKPTLTVFDLGFIANAAKLVRDGLVTPPLFFNMVFDLPGGPPATPANLVYHVNNLPPGSLWETTAYEASSFPTAAMAIATGGHARVGFEDYYYYSPGRLASSNAELVARLARIAKELERPLAKPADARKMLGLPARAPSYAMPAVSIPARPPVPARVAAAAAAPAAAEAYPTKPDGTPDFAKMTPPQRLMYHMTRLDKALG
jgi:3-keto-5-aminohexanoate cleavage enzyme